MKEASSKFIETTMPGYEGMDKSWLTTYWEVFTECIIELNAVHTVTYLRLKSDSRIAGIKMVGKSFLDFSVEDDKPFVMKELDMIKYARSSYARFTFLSLLVRYYRWTLIPFHKDGVYAGCHGVAVDVTQQKLNEMLLEEARKEAESANAAKSEFLSRMSHEIRTPMNAIIGMINIGLGADSAERKDYCFNRADSAAKHLLGIINDILDMSKIEADKFDLSYSIFNFKEAIDNITNMALVRAEEKQQDFIVNFDDDVPSYILGDELRLSQVITNLLTNASKFTPEKGTVSLSIKKFDETAGEVMLLIEVADTGIGISEEQQSRLFSPFNQADSSISQSFGGTGLGLAISKKIVELMGGIIWIESELGKGSKFIFTLQSEKIDREILTESSNKTDMDETHIFEKNGTKPVYDFSGHTILVAEDVDINREIMTAILDDTAISIDYAEDGKAAVSMFEENPGKYDLILMDINMPEMDGYEATRMICKIERLNGISTPIIAMTANVFKEDIEKCIAAGMADHIGKPIDPDNLFNKLDKYLKNIREQEEK